MLQEVRKHLQSAAQREKDILKLSGHSEVCMYNMYLNNYNRVYCVIFCKMTCEELQLRIECFLLIK